MALPLIPLAAVGVKAFAGAKGVAGAVALMEAAAPVIEAVAPIAVAVGGAAVKGHFEEKAAQLAVQRALAAGIPVVIGAAAACYVGKKIYDIVKEIKDAKEFKIAGKKGDGEFVIEGKR